MAGKRAAGISSLVGPAPIVGSPVIRAPHLVQAGPMDWQDPAVLSPWVLGLLFLEEAVLAHSFQRDLCLPCVFISETSLRILPWGLRRAGQSS